MLCLNGTLAMRVLLLQEAKILDEDLTAATTKVVVTVIVVMVSVSFNPVNNQWVLLPKPLNTLPMSLPCTVTVWVLMPTGVQGQDKGQGVVVLRKSPHRSQQLQQ